MANTVSYSSRMADDPSLESLMAEHRKEGIRNCAPIWEKATRLKKFAAREQWPDKDRQKLDGSSRKPARLTIPETSRVLATFSGRQILQRFEREYLPRNQTVSRWAETLSKVDKAIMQATDAEQVDSSAFRDGPGIQGVSWVRWYVDEWSGSKPQLKYVTVPIWAMMWPATREINLKDRGWHRWGSWWPQTTVREQWPEGYKKIASRIGRHQWSAAAQDHGQSSRIPWAGQAGNKPLPAESYYDPHNRCFWIEYEEWKELVPFYQVVRPANPSMSYAQAMAMGSTPEYDPMEVVELSPPDFKQFKKDHLAIHGEEVADGPGGMAVRKQRYVYRFAYLCGDTILDHGDVRTGYWTFSPMAAEVVELADETRYIGLLEDLEDAQKMVNYMMSALIRDIQINPKGTLFVEQGLFRDKDAALTAFTSPGGVVEIPRGRLGGSNGRPFEFVAGGTNAYSSKLENMLAFYREAIPRLAGFNPAALGQLGSDIRRVSGQVVRQLTDAAMTSNAERFDSLRLYRREGGRIFLSFARVLWEPEDLIDYIGEEDAYDDVLDPATGMPAVDPATGQPQRVLAIPPKEMWTPDAWKEIAIEEVAPGDDELSAFWDAIQTQVQLLLQPMADTGKPLFNSEDFVEIMPRLPAARRAKMLNRIRMQARQFQLAQMQAQAAANAAGQPANTNEDPNQESGAAPAA